MLGQPGSSPIELFWDIVEDVYEELYATRKTIEADLKVSNFIVVIIILKLIMYFDIGASSTNYK